jgi:hypothetical protein
LDSKNTTEKELTTIKSEIHMSHVNCSAGPNGSEVSIVGDLTEKKQRRESKRKEMMKTNSELDLAA